MAPVAQTVPTMGQIAPPSAKRPLPRLQPQAGWQVDNSWNQPSWNDAAALAGDGYREASRSGASFGTVASKAACPLEVRDPLAAKAAAILASYTSVGYGAVQAMANSFLAPPPLNPLPQVADIINKPKAWMTQPAIAEAASSIIPQGVGYPPLSELHPPRKDAANDSRSSAYVRKDLDAEVVDMEVDEAGVGHQIGFEVGARVEYWSDTHSKWVAGTVKGIRRNQKGIISYYDLNAKPKAAAARVRASTGLHNRKELSQEELAALAADQAVAMVSAASAATSASSSASRPAVRYELGEKVEYWSKKQEKWMRAEIVDKYKKEDGLLVYDLRCRGFRVRGAPYTRMRRSDYAAEWPDEEKEKANAAPPRDENMPPAKRAKVEEEPVEDDFEFWDALEACEEPLSTATRLPIARDAPLVMRRSAGADCPPPAPRARSARLNGSGGGSSGSSSISTPAETAKFSTGDLVELFNQEHGKWFPGVVTSAALNAKGVVIFYDLDCKKAVKPAEVRAAGSSAGVAKSSADVSGSSTEVFAVGDKVRYWSATHAKWVRADVLQANKGLTGLVTSYDLNLKKAADASMVRNAQTPADAPAPSKPVEPEQPMLSYKVGEKVQYRNKVDVWIDAKVQGKREDEGYMKYDLVAKTEKVLIRGAMADRLRPAPLRIGKF